MKCPCEAERSSGTGGGEAELVDPWSDPNNLRIITYEQVRNAKKVLEPLIVKTPLIRAKISDEIGMNIYIKCEFNQPTGSAKERGARYALMNLPDDQKRVGVVTASNGNHAIAMAHHGKLLGIPITVVMPVIGTLMKIQCCKSHNAEVIIHGNNINESKQFALKMCKEKGMTFINGFDHPDVLAGHGTLGIEILEDLPTANVVVVPVGGGAMLAGLSVAIKTLKPCTKVIGAESESCPSFANSLKAGKPVFTEIQSTIADSLSVPLSGYNSVATCKNRVDRMVAVKEDDIAIAVLRMVEMEKFIMDGGSGVPLGAILSGQLNDYKGKNVVVVATSGNIDTTVLTRALERGLAADGRYLKVYVTVTDKPGSVAELARLIASLGISVQGIQIERTWIMTDVFSMMVKVMCETRDFDHALELEHLLKQHYKDVSMVHADFPASTNAKSA